MRCFSWLVITIWCIKILMNIYNYFFIISKTFGENEILEQRRKLFIIVRVYHEERNIISFLEYHKGLLERAGIKIIVVGTQKERDNNNCNETLENAKILAKSVAVDGIIVVETPVEYGIGVAAQTNYAIETICKDDDYYKTWVLTVDVDAMISKENINELIWFINQNNAVIEMQSTFLKNYKKVSIWQKLHAIYQDRWAIVSEMFCGRIKNKWKYFYTNISGCGMCMRMDVLFKMGLLPVLTDYEDIHFSFLINCMGVKIKTCVTRILCEIPSNLREGLRQEYEWSFSSWDLFYYIHNLKNTFNENVNRIGLSMAVLTSAFLLIEWTVYSGVYIMAFFKAISGNLEGIIIWLMITIDYEIYGLIINKKQEESMWNFILVFICMPLEILRISIPCVCAGLARLFRIRGRKRNGIYKTKH